MKDDLVSSDMSSGDDSSGLFERLSSHPQGLAFVLNWFVFSK